VQPICQAAAATGLGSSAVARGRERICHDN
jgi:hypothetical protein